MCSKGGGSPPVPSAASTTFNSTTSPNPTVAPLYTDFLNRANTLSNTPFNPAMQGSVAPLNTEQQAAGGQLFSLGMDMGNFDPAKVQSMMSPYTESVVNATQDWFNNQNAIQGNDLISGAIRSGNAFGGDRAGVAQGVLAGQQQLAQAPVIAGLRQAGYTQALNEYNQLKQYGLQGAGAAMGWGGLEQQQAQRELDVAQQNAMMSSAYPFQTLNWYGSALGGIGPLMGQTAAGSNNPPEANSLSQAIGIGSSAIGLGSAALGAFGSGSGTAASSTTDAGSRAWRGGSIHRARGGLVDLPRGFAYGGDPSALSSDDSDDQDKYRSSDSNREEEPAPSKSDQPSLPPQHRVTRPDFGFGHLNLGNRVLPQPVFPSTSGTAAQAQPNTTSQLLDFGTKAVGLAAKAAPFFAMLSDPKTKTDVQRVGRTDDGEPLYGFRYKGDPKTYPKVVGPMAHRAGGGGIRRYANGGGEDDDQLTMTDLGVLSPGGRELPSSIAGPGRGSPSGGLPQQAEDMPNLARVRERFRPALENDPQLRARFDANTTAEVGERPQARNFYQALTLDRAAARGEALPYTLSRGPGTPDRYYPGTTIGATRTAGIGVSPSLWGGANPANYGTGNASFDPRTGRYVGFAGGPQTGSVATGSGTEYGGIEGPDRAAAQRWGYAGPSRTAIGPRGPQGTDTAAQVDAEPGERTGATAAAAGPRGPGGGQGQRPGRSGEITNIPGLEKPAPTFGQRWASNPFTQFGAAMLAGRSPRFGTNLGTAMQSTIEAQHRSQREDILDAKPEHIVLPNGEQGFRIGGKIFNLGLGVPTAETRAAGAAQRQEEEHKRRMGEPKTVDTGDELFPKKEQWFYNPQTGKYEPPAKQEAPPQTAPPATPQIAPPVTPSAPATPQPPPTTAPQVRQTGLTGDLQRSQEERVAAGERAAAGQPPDVATPAPAVPAAAAPVKAAGPAAPPPDVPLDTDQQKESAAQVAGEGFKFKTPPRVDPRLLKFMQTSPEGFDFRAQQLALGDRSVLQGLGNSKAAGAFKSALQDRAAEYMQQRYPGMGPQEANRAVAEFAAMKAGARTLGNQEARITSALKAAEGVAPLVTAISDKIPRTNYPLLNDVIIAASRNTGGEDVLRLDTARKTLISAYAQALSRGSPVLSDYKMKEADRLLQSGYSQGQMRAVVDQMMIEINRELQANKASMGQFLGRETQQPAGAAQPAAPQSTGPQDGAKRSFKEGPATFRGGKWVLD